MTPQERQLVDELSIGSPSWNAPRDATPNA